MFFLAIYRFVALFFLYKTVITNFSVVRLFFFLRCRKRSTVERFHYRQNDRQLCWKGQVSNNYVIFLLNSILLFLERKIVTRSHFPASVMVWAGITADGKTPLVFVDKGVNNWRQSWMRFQSVWKPVLQQKEVILKISCDRIKIWTVSFVLVYYAVLRSRKRIKLCSKQDSGNFCASLYMIWP